MHARVYVCARACVCCAFLCVCVLLLNCISLQVLGLQQIAIGGLNKGALSALWCGELGVPKTGNYVSEKENVDEDILTCVQASAYTGVRVV